MILYTEKLEARLPQDKVDRICEFNKIILHKSSCTKRELLQLLGHMNFATRVKNIFLSMCDVKVYFTECGAALTTV